MHPDSEYHIAPCVDSEELNLKEISFLTIIISTNLPVVVRYLLEDPTWQVSFSVKIPVR